MKKFIVLLALVVLAACVPEYESQEISEPTVRAVKEQVVAKERVIPEPAFRVWQSRGKDVFEWGLDEKNRIVRVNDSSNILAFYYEGERLLGIDDGISQVQFFYDKDGRLLSAERGLKRWIFTYSSSGNLLSFENGERFRFTYDSLGRLSSVSRDSGARTEFSYNKKSQVESMFFGEHEFRMYYDDRSRLKLINREDDNLVIAYWREDLLSSLSGTMYGLKETVNYGPVAIKLISNADEQEFRSLFEEEKQQRLEVFNTFLFCTRFRKLPVTFDGQSWVLYREYLRGGLVDYLQKTFVCDYLP